MHTIVCDINRKIESHWAHFSFHFILFYWMQPCNAKYTLFDRNYRVFAFFSFIVIAFCAEVGFHRERLQSEFQHHNEHTYFIKSWFTRIETDTTMYQPHNFDEQKNEKEKTHTNRTLNAPMQCVCLLVEMDLWHLKLNENCSCHLFDWICIPIWTLHFNLFI